MAGPASHIPEASSPARSPRCPQSKDRSTHLSEDETLSARSSALAAIHHKDTKSRVPCRGYLTRAPRPEAARLVGRGQPRRRDVPLHLCHCPQVLSACRTRKRIADPSVHRPNGPRLSSLCTKWLVAKANGCLAIGQQGDDHGRRFAQFIADFVLTGARRRSGARQPIEIAPSRASSTSSIASPGGNNRTANWRRSRRGPDAPRPLRH